MKFIRLIFLYILLMAGVFITFYLSWIPQPDLSKLRYMPAWLGRWTNAHDTLRTAVTFIYLGFFSGILLLIKTRQLRWWFYSWLLLVFVVTIVEFGQLFLSLRVFDWRDIFWGASGALMGMVTACFISMWIKVFPATASRK